MSMARALRGKRADAPFYWEFHERGFQQAGADGPTGRPSG